MRKVIFIIVDNLRNGGAGRVASLLANSMIKRHEVYVFVKDPVINYKIDTKVHYHVLKDKAWLRPFKIIKRVKDLSRQIKQYRPDVIYPLGYVSKYTTFALMLSGHKKVKVIASERSDPHSEPASSIMKRVRDYSFGKADILVCQTNMAADFYNSRIKTKTVVIPNPITPNLPTWEGIDSNKIVTACRLDVQKNIPMLLQAFQMFSRQYPQYELEIYGDGPLRSSLDCLIKQMSLDNSVHLMGNTNNIHEILAQSFMFVLSSDNEGMSNSMLEALAIGVPSVCTDCPIGGAAMTIENKVNGLLVPIKDSNAFCDAMIWIVENKNKLNQMSSTAQTIRERQSVEKIVKMWEDLIS